MKLKNPTDFNGRDLRGLLLSCARYYEVKLGDGVVEIYHPREGVSRLSRARGGHKRFVLRLCPSERYLRALSVVDKLAAVENGGWAAVPAVDFLQLCSSVDWIVSGNIWVEELPPWAEDRQLRFKVPPPKVKATGADYHQEKIAKLEAQIERWQANQKVAEQNVARIKRGIAKRKKDLKCHTKQRDKKAESAK